MSIDFRTVVLQHEYVLVRPLREPERADGSRLFKPDASRGHQQRGLVLAVGPGEALPIAPSWRERWRGQPARRPIAIQPGDLAFYGKYAGFSLDESEAVYVMRDLEIPFFVRAGAFVLVEHERPELAHLAGEFCQTCVEADEQRQRELLARERPKAFPLGGG